MRPDELYGPPPPEPPPPEVPIRTTELPFDVTSGYMDALTPDQLGQVVGVPSITQPTPPTLAQMRVPIAPPEIPWFPSTVRDPGNPYITPTMRPQEPPPYIQPPNLWELGQGGRPTATRLGVSPDIGGMQQEANRTFAASNVLLPQVLATLPPIFQQFANRPISRFDVTDVYGNPANTGGFYSQPNQPPRAPGGPIAPTLTAEQQRGAIAVGRGNEQVTQPGYDATTVARHELIHALSFEVAPFSNDARNNFALLQYATQQSWAALHAPQYHNLADSVQANAANRDWAHVFTDLAETALRGQPLPPPLQRYFAPMFTRPGAPMSPPAPGP